MVTQALIIYYFDLKYYIQIKTAISNNVICQVLN